MDRLEQIIEALEPFNTAWIGKKIRECRTKAEPKLTELTEQTLAEVKEKQELEDRPLSYLILFHYRSSQWTGTNRYRICASDENLYLTPPLALKDWIPEHLYSDTADLKTAIEKELKLHFVRIKPFEVTYAHRVILEEYQKLAERYWRQTTEQVIKKDLFQTLKKQENWSILSGTYMDELKIVLQSEKRR